MILWNESIIFYVMIMSYRYLRTTYICHALSLYSLWASFITNQTQFPKIISTANKFIIYIILCGDKSTKILFIYELYIKYITTTLQYRHKHLHGRFLIWSTEWQYPFVYKQSLHYRYFLHHWFIIHNTKQV